MISVVIPTCDRPLAFLLAAIDSVRSQSHAPGEIIVVDNGRSAVDAASLPHGVALYRLQPRVGPSRARNFGAAIARGSHLAFLDDDDLWDADFLREAQAALAEHGARCVYGRIDRLRGERREPHKAPTEASLNVATLMRRNPGTGGQNLLIEKVLFWEVGGFDHRLRTSEDKALAIELLRRGEPIAVAPRAVTLVREHAGERLSRNRWPRLRFVWQYRALSGPVDTGKLALAIVAPKLAAAWRRLKALVRA